MTDLKAAVGSILFLWSSLERTLGEQIDRLDGGASGPGVRTLSQKITRWQSLQSEVSANRPEHGALLAEILSRLGAALDLRNRIAHGLIGFRADEQGDRGGACLTTELNGSRRQHGVAELNQMMRHLSHLSDAVASLTDAALETDPDSARNRWIGIRTNHLS